jgi:hypothetical protein
MMASFKEWSKMSKLAAYLDAVPVAGLVESDKLSKKFCLTSAAAAGKHVAMRGDFEKQKAGLWRKVE